MASRQIKKLPQPRKDATKPLPDTEPDETVEDTAQDTDSQQDQTQPSQEELEAERAQSPNDATRSMLTEPEPERIDYASLPNAPQDSIILGPGEHLVVDGEISADGTTLKLSKAVYRAFLPMGSKRWAFTLEYPLGAEIPASMVVATDRQHPATPTTSEQAPEETGGDTDNENDQNDE